MELFSITCTTCKSRLRVRDEGAIGQILACPKCHGMVMVKAPEGWEPGKPLPPPRPEPVAGITAVVEMKKTDDTSSDANFDAIDDILVGINQSKFLRWLMEIAAVKLTWLTTASHSRPMDRSIPSVARVCCA